MSECERCGSNYILRFSQMDYINDVAYTRFECEECGYWKILNSNNCSITEDVNESTKQLYSEMLKRGITPYDLNPKELLTPIEKNTLRLIYG